MKLYFAPGACSIGIHFLLESLGLSYERQRVDIRSGENLKAWYSDVNPKQKVPTLQLDDGGMLTEFPVIARYLAEENQSKGYFPNDKRVLLRASELTEFAVSTVHMQGFSRAFRPGKFVVDEAAHDAVKAQGGDIILTGYAVIESQIGEGGALRGKQTFADAALFYVFFWGAERLKVPLPAACAAK